MPTEIRQFYAYHLRRKVLRGPFTIAPGDALATFARATDSDLPEGDPLKGSSDWRWGTLEEILRLPEVERQDVARALGVRE